MRCPAKAAVQPSPQPHQQWGKHHPSQSPGDRYKQSAGKLSGVAPLNFQYLTKALAATPPRHCHTRAHSSHVPGYSPCPCLTRKVCMPEVVLTYLNANRNQELEGISTIDLPAVPHIYIQASPPRVKTRTNTDLNICC